MTKIEIPDFASEAEEAQWWFDNQDALDDEFLAAGTEGKLTQGTLAKQFGLASNVVRLDPEDVQLAREIAAKRGLDYEQFIQSLIHETLLAKEQEAAQQGTSKTVAA
jgi:predicted DNA binding CopG/RHH family protein